MLQWLIEIVQYQTWYRLEGLKCIIINLWDPKYLLPRVIKLYQILNYGNGMMKYNS